jgi:hypothetical protein
MLVHSVLLPGFDDQKSAIFRPGTPHLDSIPTRRASPSRKKRSSAKTGRRDCTTPAIHATPARPYFGQPEWISQTGLDPQRHPSLQIPFVADEQGPQHVEISYSEWKLCRPKVRHASYCLSTVLKAWTQPLVARNLSAFSAPLTHRQSGSPVVEFTGNSASDLWRGNRTNEAEMANASLGRSLTTQPL